MTQQPSHADLQSDIATLLERVEANGRQAHDGFLAVNTRLKAIEDRVLALDRLRDKVMGALAVAGLFIGVIWWMIQDRIEAVLGIGK